MILQENVKYSCNTCFSTKCKTDTSVSAQRMHECKWSGMLKFSLCDWKSLLQKCMMFKPACPPKVPGFPNLGQSWEEQVEAKRGIWVRLFFASWNFEYDHPKGRHPEKMLLFFWILSKLPPPLPLPPIWSTCTTFLNAQNADLSYIQNDSLSKILLK